MALVFRKANDAMGALIASTSVTKYNACDAIAIELNSNAPMARVYRDRGCAIRKMIVGTRRMSLIAQSANVIRSLNLNVMDRVDDVLTDRLCAMELTIV
jgi:hypothetical protein